MSKAAASDKKAQSFDTRIAHKVLLDGLSSIQASLEGADIDRQIEVGSVLWDLHNRVEEVMKVIKKVVRAEAVKDLNGKVGTTTLEGDDMGEAIVIIPSAQLVIPKGRDIEDLKRALGPKFSFFFEETVTYAPHEEYEERVEKTDDALTQKILLEAVERKELTPRVKFRRNRPSRRDGGGEK